MIRRLFGPVSGKGARCSNCRSKVKSLCPKVSPNIFGDGVTASAIADRLCHRCTILRITGRSYRLKDLTEDDRRTPEERGEGK